MKVAVILEAVDIAVECPCDANVPTEGLKDRKSHSA